METVKVLHSRSRVGVKGDVIKVTTERKKELLALGLVKPVGTPKQAERETKKTQRGRNDAN